MKNADPEKSLIAEATEKFDKEISSASTYSDGTIPSNDKVDCTDAKQDTSLDSSASPSEVAQPQDSAESTARVEAQSQTSEMKSTLPVSATSPVSVQPSEPTTSQPIQHAIFVRVPEDDPNFSEKDTIYAITFDPDCPIISYPLKPVKLSTVTSSLCHQSASSIKASSSDVNVNRVTKDCIGKCTSAASVDVTSTKPHYCHSKPSAPSTSTVSTNTIADETPNEAVDRSCLDLVPPSYQNSTPSPGFYLWNPLLLNTAYTNYHYLIGNQFQIPNIRSVPPFDFSHSCKIGGTMSLDPSLKPTKPNDYINPFKVQSYTYKGTTNFSPIYLIPLNSHRPQYNTLRLRHDVLFPQHSNQNFEPFYVDGHQGDFSNFQVNNRTVFVENQYYDENQTSIPDVEFSEQRNSPYFQQDSVCLQKTSESTVLDKQDSLYQGSSYQHSTSESTVLDAQTLLYQDSSYQHQNSEGIVFNEQTSSLDANSKVFIPKSLLESVKQRALNNPQIVKFFSGGKAENEDLLSSEPARSVHSESILTGVSSSVSLDKIGYTEISSVASNAATSQTQLAVDSKAAFVPSHQKQNSNIKKRNGNSSDISTKFATRCIAENKGLNETSDERQSHSAKEKDLQPEAKENISGISTELIENHGKNWKGRENQHMDAYTKECVKRMEAEVEKMELAEKKCSGNRKDSIKSAKEKESADTLQVHRGVKKDNVFEKLSSMVFENKTAGDRTAIRTTRVEQTTAKVAKLDKVVKMKHTEDAAKVISQKFKQVENLINLGHVSEVDSKTSTGSKSKGEQSANNCSTRYLNTPPVGPRRNMNSNSMSSRGQTQKGSGTRISQVVSNSTINSNRDVAVSTIPAEHGVMGIDPNSNKEKGKIPCTKNPVSVKSVVVETTTRFRAADPKQTTPDQVCAAVAPKPKNIDRFFKGVVDSGQPKDEISINFKEEGSKDIQETASTPQDSKKKRRKNRKK